MWLQERMVILNFLGSAWRTLFTPQTWAPSLCQALCLTPGHRLGMAQSLPWGIQNRAGHSRYVNRHLWWMQYRRKEERATGGRREQLVHMQDFWVRWMGFRIQPGWVGKKQNGPKISSCQTSSDQHKERLVLRGSTRVHLFRSPVTSFKLPLAPSVGHRRGWHTLGWH